MSSDELADAKGMTENEFMADLTKDIEMWEGKKVTPVKIKALRKKAKTLYEKLDPKAYQVIKDVLGKIEAVLAKPTVKTKEKIIKREEKLRLKNEEKAFKEWQRSYRAETVTPKQALNRALTKAKKLTDQGVKDRLDMEVKRIFFPGLRTPEFVLNKMGLKEKIYTPLKKGSEKVAKELEGYVERSNKWWRKIARTNKGRKKSSKKIFRWLDGQNIELNKKELGVAMHMKNYLAKWADRLGLPEDKRIARYITHIFEPDFERGKRIFPDELARILDYVTPNKEFNPFLEKRTGAKGYKEDVFEALDAYVYRASRKLYLDKALGDAAKLVDYIPLQASRYVD